MKLNLASSLLSDTMKTPVYSLGPLVCSYNGVQLEDLVRHCADMTGNFLKTRCKQVGMLKLETTQCK